MKFENCVRFPINLMTDREGHLHGEGGALNANYTQVEAVAKMGEICGRQGLMYGRDWYMETCSENSIIISFSEEKYATMVSLSLNKGHDE